MIDLHGHYLPGVDDGAENLEQSLAMLRHAESDGIEAVVATPHACGNTCKVKDLECLRRSYEKWQTTLKKSGLAPVSYTHLTLPTKRIV